MPAQCIEISARQFGGIRHVGADSIRPPTLQIFEQNRYTPTGATILPMYRVSTKYHRISFANVRHCIVGALRRRCFPMGKTTGRLIAVILWCDRPRRSLNFDSLRGAPPLRGRCHQISARVIRRASLCGPSKPPSADLCPIKKRKQAAISVWRPVSLYQEV